jgi:hypothetical protein
MVAAIRVKSPFSHNALFGFVVVMAFGFIRSLRVDD